MRAALLPLAPRAVASAVAAMLAGAILVLAYPSFFFAIGDQGDSQGRLVGVFEAVPMISAIILAQALAPRLPQWDRYGTVKTRHTALVLAAVTVVLPCGCFFGLLLLYPSWGDPPASTLRPIVNNVAIAGLLAVILVGVLGRLGGVLAWVAVIYTVMWVPVRWPWLGAVLPLNLTNPGLGRPELDIRWWWLIALSALALTVAWQRRLVPVQWAIRPAEERQ